MPHISRTSRHNLAVFATAFVGIALLNYFMPYFMPGISLTSVLYSLLMLLWGLSVKRRILGIRERRTYLLGVLLLLLLFLLRMLRYLALQDIPWLSCLFWYLYYLPFTAIPLCSLTAALLSGQGEAATLPHGLRYLWYVWAVLFLGILTNDLHGLMFRIYANTYRYGPLFYVCVLWVSILTLTGFLILLRHCRLSQCRRLWPVPVLAAVPGTALLAWYYACGGSSPQLAGYNLYNLQEAYALLFLLIWESCIQIGLVPTNTDYATIFALSPLDALITDREGHILHSAAHAPLPTPAQLAQALEGPLALDDDHLLHSHPIRHGTVYWQEDVGEIHRANQEIAEAIEYLEDEQSLLTEETRIRAERERYEIQNRLYDSVAPLVQPQLTRAAQLLSDPYMDEQTFRAHLMLSLILCVYAKRRLNLALLAYQAQTLSSGELELALFETLEYLRVQDIACGMEPIGDAREVPTARLLLAYDFFAAVLEAALPDMEALLVLLRTQPYFALKLNVESPSALPARHWRLKQQEALGAHVSYEKEDSLLYARLRFSPEEAAV